MKTPGSNLASLYDRKIYFFQFYLSVKQSGILIKHSSALVSAMLASLLWVTNATSAEEVARDDPIPNFGEAKLSGDWGGVRANQYKKGIDYGFTHKSDVMMNLSGGIEQGTVLLGHTEARLALDLEKLLGWDSTSAYFNYHSNLGSKFNNYYVGSYMGVDNIEVATNTAQFYNAWIQKTYFSDVISIRAGLYSIDSEFYVTDTSGLFIASPYGMANEISQTDTPAIFPLGGLAVRAKFTSPAKNCYFQAAVVDGVPGDPGNAYGTHIILGHGEGSMSILELGYTPQEEKPSTPELAESNQEEAESFNKTAFGLWQYSRSFNDLLATDATRRHAQGIYILAERTLFSEKKHPSQGLAGFMRLGTASQDIYPVDWTASFGLRYHGLFSGRDDDIAGIAVTYNHASNKYRQLAMSNSGETDWEFTYRANLKPWLSFQPDVQYIINPGMNSGIKNAWVVGFRTEVEF
jgi:porin